MSKTIKPETAEKCYHVIYWERSSMDVYVRANSPEEAEKKVNEMSENGELDLSLLELGDSGVGDTTEISEKEYNESVNGVNSDDLDEDDDEE